MAPWVMGWDTSKKMEMTDVIFVAVDVHVPLVEEDQEVAGVSSEKKVVDAVAVAVRVSLVEEGRKVATVCCGRIVVAVYVHIYQN